MAARAGQANVVKFLVANGADVDAKAKVSERYESSFTSGVCKDKCCYCY